MDKKSFMKAALAPTRAFAAEPAPIVPFADWDYFYIKENLTWRSNEPQSSESVTAPRGFVTDLASIPTALWGLLPPSARYSYPAIIHDYLYWFQPCSREWADLVFKTAMEDLQVSGPKVFTIYNSVRAGGQSAWDDNATARAAGERRILKRFPSDIKITWEMWRTDPENFATE